MFNKPKIGITETRTIANASLRTSSQGDEIALAGYAALFNSTSKDLGGFREVIAPGAFTRTLKAGDDVKALVNHDPSQLLGRSKNKTLTLTQDERGLKFRVVLNPKSTAHRDLYAAVERGDMDECSFAFTVGDGQDWDEGEDENGLRFQRRTLKDVKLMDISAVTYPAYDGTSVGARSHRPDYVGVPVAEIDRRNWEKLNAIGEQLLAERREAAKQIADAEHETSFEQLLLNINNSLYRRFGKSENAIGARYVAVETYPDYVIAFDTDEDSYCKLPYELDSDGEVLLGQMTMVEKDWVPSARAFSRTEEARNKKVDNDKKRYFRTLSGITS